MPKCVCEREEEEEPKTLFIVLLRHRMEIEIAKNSAAGVKRTMHAAASEPTAAPRYSWIVTPIRRREWERWGESKVSSLEHIKMSSPLFVLSILFWKWKLLLGWKRKDYNQVHFKALWRMNINYDLYFSANPLSRGVLPVHTTLAQRISSLWRTEYKL